MRFVGKFRNVFHILKELLWPETGNCSRLLEQVKSSKSEMDAWEQTGELSFEKSPLV